MAQQFVTSVKGKDLLVHQVLKSGETVWECTKRRNYQACNTIVKTKNGAVIAVLYDHLHNPNVDEIKALKARISMKQRAKDSTESTQAIIKGSIEGLPQSTLAKLEKTESFADNARNMNPMFLVTMIFVFPSHRNQWRF